MAQESSVDFSEFGKTFQESLACLLLSERQFCDQIREVLKVNYFEQAYLQVFVSKVFDYKDKYNTHPTLKTMKTILRTELKTEDELTKNQVIDFLARHLVGDKELKRVENTEFVKDKSLDFCKKQTLYHAMEKSIEILPKSSFEDIRTLINTALNLGLDSDFGHDYIADFEERYKIKCRNPISTGWSKIDSITKGGLGAGELGVVLASTGAGKSHVLSHLGSQGVIAGKQVVHYTLELSAESTGLRYDSCLTGASLDSLRDCKDKVLEEISKFPGKLTIKEYPTKSATTRTIKNHLDKMCQRGNAPDLILVDYADLLRPVSSYKEKRMELESIYEELRGIAGEFKCGLYTASQTNRSGINAEIITMESISEAFSKAFVADFIFSISRTMDDREALSGRMFIAKSRLGPDGLVYPLMFDPSCVRIEILDAEESLASVVESVKERAGKKLKDFYAQNRDKL